MTRKPRRLLSLVAALVMVVVSIGPAFGAGTHVHYEGSTTLGPTFDASRTAFVADGHPGWTLDSHYIGSSDGELGLQYTAQQAGTPVNNPISGTYSNAPTLVDVAGRSSPFASSAKHTNYWIRSVARDGLSIIINTQDFVAGMAVDKCQLKAIYQGDNNPATSAKFTLADLGATGSTSIIPVARDLVSGSRASFLEQVGAQKSGTTFPLEEAYIASLPAPYNARFTTSDDVVTAVKNNRNTIAYVGLGFTSDPGIAVVPVLASCGAPRSTGVVGSAYNIYTNDPAKAYPLRRLLYMGMLKKAFNGNVANTAAREYINWQFTWRGQNIWAEDGFIRVLPREDVNGNGLVNIVDVSAVGLRWQQSVPAGTPEDVNQNGVVNIVDVSAIGSLWNLTIDTAGTDWNISPIPVE